MVVATDDLLSAIQNWYASRTDGDWEHQFGVEISTLDNPGWVVKVDLRETPWEYLSFASVKLENGKADWLNCQVEEAQFVGYGDPHKLIRLLQIIKDWLWELKLTPEEVVFLVKACPTLAAAELSAPVAQMPLELKEQIREVCSVQYAKVKKQYGKDGYDLQGFIGDLNLKML